MLYSLSALHLSSASLSAQYEITVNAHYTECLLLHANIRLGLCMSVVAHRMSMSICDVQVMEHGGLTRHNSPKVRPGHCISM